MVSVANSTGSAITGPRIMSAIPAFISAIRARQPAVSPSAGKGACAGRATAKAACASRLIDLGDGNDAFGQKEPFGHIPAPPRNYP